MPSGWGAWAWHLTGPIWPTSAAVRTSLTPGAFSASAVETMVKRAAA